MITLSIAVISLISLLVTLFASHRVVSTVIQPILAQVHSENWLIESQDMKRRPDREKYYTCSTYKIRFGLQPGDSNDYTYQQQLLRSFSTLFAQNAYDVFGGISLLQIESHTQKVIPTTSDQNDSMEWLQGSTPGPCKYNVVLRILPKAEAGISSTCRTSSAHNGCIITLPLHNSSYYDEKDVDAIYNATAMSASCLRNFLRSPAPEPPLRAIHTEGDDSYYSSSNFQLSEQEVRAYRHRSLVQMLHSSCTLLSRFLRLHGYEDSPWMILFAPASLQKLLAEVFRLLGDVKRILEKHGISDYRASDAGNHSRISAAAVEEALAPARAAYLLLQDLDENSEFAKKAAVPPEQYFAIYGPYWLPLLVPVVRGIRMLWSPAAVGAGKAN